MAKIEDKDYQYKSVKDREKKEDLDLDVENILEADSSFVDDIEVESTNPNETNERGVINEKNNSSILIKENGDIVLAADSLAQIQINNPNKAISSVSYTNSINTNRMSLSLNELEINDHKINQRIWELADQRMIGNNKDYSIGNLNMSGYVLMKHWEKDLEKWVLIRRKIRMPLFYPEKTLPDTPELMSMDTEIDFGTQSIGGKHKDIAEQFFGLSEKDPAYQDSESKEQIDEVEHIIESQKVDPLEDIIIDMGPINSNTGNLVSSLDGNVISDTDINGNSTKDKDDKNDEDKTSILSDAPKPNVKVIEDKNIKKQKDDVYVYDLNKMKDKYISRHLKVSHFRCNDGNNIVVINPKLVNVLEELFSKVKSDKFNIVSAFRTVSYNKQVNGVSNSQHLYGNAIDISFKDVSAREVANSIKDIKGCDYYISSNNSYCHINIKE